MPRKGWGRHRRHDDWPRTEPDPENVDLSGPEHAWWAGRDLEGGIPEGQQGSSRSKGRLHAPRPEPKKSGFEEYFTADSLFEPAEPSEPPATKSPNEDPYGTLGVPETSSWEEITAAHRRLAKEHHPDRLGQATAEERAKGEAFIRDLNIAYMELRRRRAK